IGLERSDHSTPNGSEHVTFIEPLSRALHDFRNRLMSQAIEINNDHGAPREVLEPELAGNEVAVQRVVTLTIDHEDYALFAVRRALQVAAQRGAPILDGLLLIGRNPGVALLLGLDHYDADLDGSVGPHA